MISERYELKRIEDYYQCRKNSKKYAYWFLGDVKTNKIDFSVRNNFGYLSKTQRESLEKFLIENNVKYTKYKYKNITVKLNKRFYDLEGNENKAKRYCVKTMGEKYKVVKEKKITEELKEGMRATVKKWSSERYEIYKRFQHSGYDLFFINNYLDLSLIDVFTLRNSLDVVSGFSIFTKAQNGSLCCPLRKTDYSDKDLDFFLDITSFRMIYEKYGDVYISWGAVKGGRASVYKKKFPHILEDVWFINTKKKEL